VLNAIVLELQHTPKEENCNLIATNVVLHSSLFRPAEIFTGFPLQSLFMGFEEHSTAAIIHK